ncbi:ATP-binding cassette subfamily B multidrug efflux pump [Rhodoligotrophos appendicifer]|uniref:ABC transporter ATP-binding protein n=1 Tax=Rhodoligotrophos appendicifer TaxID=987056 RepID=UPI00248239D4|nr:ABC transporter ATP-binding protein [Rhodoligotrophos appendicifer]
MIFRLFETMLEPTAAPLPGAPPSGILPFYWHFVRQARGLFASLLIMGALLAAADAAMPVLIGWVVQLVAGSEPEAFLSEGWMILVGMALLLLVIRPVILTTQALLQHQAIFPGVTNLVRWQSHKHVVRQSLAYFQSDFAGRIASRVMETGYALRASAVSVISVIWYLVSFAMAMVAIMLVANPWLAVPSLAWIAGYVILLWTIVPQVRVASSEIAFARSALTGRIVDSYTNIMTVKLFARTAVEDAYVREAVDWHTGRMRKQLRWFTWLTLGLAVLSGFLIAATGGLALWLWSEGAVGVETVATVLTLTLQMSTTSGRVAYELTQVSEQFGTVREGMETVARPLRVVDQPGAPTLQVTLGEIQFKDIRFGYGRETGLIEGLNLTIRPGEKIGLIGRSGAGKSTLINLLLRFYDLEDGQILIDGQDIATVTQQSVREAIAVVTQDTSLLHRSIRENIAYGKPGASDEKIISAARQAHAHEFIMDLEDWRGRHGYDAHVGERGVKLSGGQRQRIAISRVILKSAPILILDEATSALDSEVEAAIQEQLETLMESKTVIAIAHRLSTIARMDRLVVMDGGRIIEEGNHAELLAHGGKYAQLWARQSGGFLDLGANEPATVP